MFAIVELMGHRRFGAQVTADELAGVKVLRCEVLAPDHPDASLLVQHVHPQALYALTECTEAQARAANRSTYAIQSPLAIEATTSAPDDNPFAEARPIPEGIDQGSHRMFAVFATELIGRPPLAIGATRESAITAFVAQYAAAHDDGLIEGEAQARAAIENFDVVVSRAWVGWARVVGAPDAMPAFDWLDTDPRVFAEHRVMLDYLLGEMIDEQIRPNLVEIVRLHREGR